MDNILLRDANGIEFNVNLKNDIFQINHDMCSDSNKNFVNKVDNNVSRKPIEIIDSSGKAFTINDSLNENDAIDHIVINVEASHSDTKINSSYYTGDSMLRDFTSYVSPYQKPMIKNHDNHCEPIGRIVRADCTDSSILQGTKCIDVEARINDEDAIKKILDGRYQTVSIGAYPKSITCQTCGKKILHNGKFDFCGHWRGNVYKDKTTNEEKECTWKMEDLEYNELSMVNSPADAYAQIYKVKVVRKSDLKETKNSKEGENKMNIGNEKEDLIEQVLNLNDKIAKTVENNVNNENEQSKESTTSIENTEVEKTLDEEALRIKEENEALKSELETLKNSNSVLESKIAVLDEDNKSLSVLNNKIATIFKERIITITNELDENVVVDNNDKLEVLNNKLSEVIKNFKESIVNKEVVLNNENSNADSTVIEQAQNPGLVNNSDKRVEEVEDEVIEEKQNIAALNNAKSFEKLINSAIK